MSLRNWLLAGGVLVVLAACQKEKDAPAPATEEPAVQEAAADPFSVFEKGVVNVYFDDDMIALIEEDLLAHRGVRHDCR